MGHSIFLSSEQIESVIKGQEVKAEGACVPVIQNRDGSNTEPSGEMITKYRIKVGDKAKIIGTDRGFTISVVRPEDLLPSPDGCQWINFNSINQFNTGRIIHQVALTPESILLDSWMDKS